ncbi:3329_t:CDS:2 [Diversispora eburnea]|uniref:3329_t:CDS:1 n=1 Tax=Diversispora eburnea TaxID=1213867 RepID=A0A9N9CQN9_9GLOM|nr:3329_t:CDS:2 [Diversispora eburnea]
MDVITESLIPTNVHEFLVNFFSQNLTAKEWNYQIDDLRAPNKEDFIMNSVVRVLCRTLPQLYMHFCGISRICIMNTSKNHVKGNRADRISYMTDTDKHQLIYMEGSRPVTKDEKEINDLLVRDVTASFNNARAEPRLSFADALLRLDY